MTSKTSNRSFLRRHLWQVMGVVVVVVLAWVFLPRLLFGPTVRVIEVVQRDFVQSVVASGRVEAPHRIDIGTQLTGVVAKVPVAEGQQVKADEVLVELDNSELRASAQQADHAVAQASARLRQLREVQAPVAEQTVAQAQAALDLALVEQHRNEDLVAKGFASRAALDQSRTNVKMADAQLRAARHQHQSARTGGSEHALAETVLAAARASADAARARLGYATIRAPVDGTLISRNVERGDVVQPGKVLMTLSPAGDIQLVVQIDEKNLALLSVGQQVQASADAYPGKRFAATLAYISPGVNVQTGAVEVKLDVADPPAVLRQDMTVSVDIAVARRAGALLVPTDAVHDVAGRTPWVLLVTGGRAHRRSIRIGLRSAGWIEVLDGLAAGDRIVPSDVPNIVDGSRLRARVDDASGA
ncbi:MAG: efflux RND transporter periplasmic adaptor subunit [Burkholderiales bacterium]|nr:efflux RND transporter periplasmic adaptor subunit [Burkholderiales bacterium]